MAGREYRHIFLEGPTDAQGFTNPRRGSPTPRIPERNRDRHSAHLHRRFELAWNEAEQRRARVHVERHGVYIDFMGEPDCDLLTQSLEYRPSGIRLLNVRCTSEEKEKKQTAATVYVPRAKRGHFLRRIEAYQQEETRSGKPKNQNLVNSISDIRASVLESFWQDDIPLPGEAPSEVEVWLSSDKDPIIEQFDSLLGHLEIKPKPGVLKFPERAVKIVLANRGQLEALIERSDYIAELRAAKEVALFFVAQENRDQLKQVQELLGRTRFNAESEAAVCVLDTGVNNGHSLIAPVLSGSDLHTVIPAWDTHDHNGHGTLVAGTAAYGDLVDALNNANPMQIDHCLESAKILPPPPATNPKELWGYMTAQGISLAEIQAPERMRITCMAVTSTDSRDRGRPSSWSATVDELASGYEDERYRMVVVSAGNADDPKGWRNYPEDNLTNEIHDPAQAWNALTVGAYTEKTKVVDATLRSFVALAPEGGLSPYSTTSATWAGRVWPIKPEVVFEGGNVARGPNDGLAEADELQLLSTHHDPQVAQFRAFSGTSAAAPQAARMAARIQALYPEAWPETIRALIVHTASWTEALRKQFLARPSPTRHDYANLLRVCGYGVPNLERALYCASNSLTLISQAELQPFDRQDGRYVTHEMHLYDLPWPSEILTDLGRTEVEMRVTLSYFIEPGPGQVGWENRYRYASHALRFVVNGPGESGDEFVRRVNEQARTDGEHPGTSGPGDKWIIGEARNVGSITPTSGGGAPPILLCRTR